MEGYVAIGGPLDGAVLPYQGERVLTHLVGVKNAPVGREIIEYHYVLTAYLEQDGRRTFRWVYKTRTP